MHATSPRTPLPPVAGIGLRGPHLAQILKQRPSAGWLEVHAENYMKASPAAAALEQVRKNYALSVHGVGLSLGSATGVDPSHLARLKQLCDRFQPAMVSEHLAWCVGDGIYLNDLLPVPYDEEALAIVCRNIEQTQETIGRRILIENLSAYVGFARSTMMEPEFLSEIAERTGCGLLLDINNVYVSAHNLGFDAQAYIAALPAESIEEIHLAGHAENMTDDGPVLIDNHGSAVAPQVWSLYRFALERIGVRPTLIEWDSEIPPLETLLGEAMWADLLANSVTEDARSMSAFLPPSRAQTAKVALCDHHPARMMEHVHA
ncbi:MNIO family bufferin maturase [Taklimakanibacter lacteus]|uniref:MNIO family bufferin maturase n=1 Tax=Taklimakanibacter lacteus TaxID=2268456 RepID=UPI000E66406B